MIEPGDSEPEVGEVGRLLVVYYGEYETGNLQNHQFRFLESICFFSSTNLTSFRHFCSLTSSSSWSLKLTVYPPGLTTANITEYPPSHADPAVHWHRDDLARCCHGCHHRDGAAP